MPQICALQINPIETLKYESDTSILIAETLQKRGFKIFYYTPNQLFLANNKVQAKGRYVNLNYEAENFFTYQSEESTLELNLCKLVLIRQNPPFDMNYITNTYLLEHLDKKVLVLNNPRSIRNWPEKLSVFKFTQYLPPTIISCDTLEITKFYHTYKNIILKPIYGGGGDAVCKIENDRHFHKTLEKYIKLYKYIIAQKFFSEIKHGDKRVFILDGKILGAIKRIPAPGSHLANLAAGGTASVTELTEKEHNISLEVAKSLKASGIFFAGIDLINEHLIEINVTSPTGLKAYNRLYNTKCEEVIVDNIINKIQ